MEPNLNMPKLSVAKHITPVTPIRLELRPSSFFETAFIQQCLEELEAAMMAAVTSGQPMSALHQLANQVLMDSTCVAPIHNPKPPSEYD